MSTLGKIFWGAVGVVFLLIVAVTILGFARRAGRGTIVATAAQKIEHAAGLVG